MTTTAEDVHTSNETILQWATFQLAGETYGVDVMQVREVLRYQEITPVPGAPRYVLGIINLRGKVITVVDTRARFAVPAGDVGEASRIMVVEADDQVIGMLVDSVSEVVYIKEREIEQTPDVGNMEAARFIQGVAYKNEELLIFIDLERMVASDEELATAPR